MPNIRSLIRRLLSKPNELEKGGILDWDYFQRFILLTAEATFWGIGYSVLALQTCSIEKCKISNPIENPSSQRTGLRTPSPLIDLRTQFQLIDPITPTPPIGPIPLQVSINRAQLEAVNYRRNVAMARELNEFDKKEESLRDSILILRELFRKYQNLSPILTDLGDKSEIRMVALKTQRFLNGLTNTDMYRTPDSFFSTAALFLITEQDLKNLCTRHNLAQKDSLECARRLKQALGLPPSCRNDIVLVFQVSKHDLFRPAIDSSINKSGQVERLTKQYLVSLMNYSKASYANQNDLLNYPFTSFGYTFDTHPQSDNNHFGVTEFVVKESRDVKIVGWKTLYQYIKDL